jgi:hypothetical protein
LKSEKILKIRKKSKLRSGMLWIVKRFEKYRRKVSWKVKR